MTVNVWAVVGTTPGYLPLSALTGTAGQLLGMDATATFAEWKAGKFLANQFYGPVGSEGTPLYSFEGDLNTGIYQDGADALGFSAGGTRRAKLSSAGLILSVPAQLVGKLLEEDKGADISAAATTDLGTATGNFVRVTNVAGNTIITSLGGDTLPAGTEIETPFSITGGSVSITHNAVSLILLGGSNIVLVDKDVIRWRKINDASAFWEMVGFQRGTSTSQFTARGDLLVGEDVAGTIVPGVLKTNAVAGLVPISDPTQVKGIRWETSAAARKNAIINGDFNVWQRGTSFAAIASGAYAADRWLYLVVGDAVHTVSRSTDVPTVAEAGRLFNYSLLVDCTTVDAAIAAGDLCAVQHRVEGYNFLPLAQRAVTLSFWVKGTKTGIHCAALSNSATPDRSCVKEYTINTTDTWERKTLTYPASPSAGTWDYTTGIGIRISFALSAGSTYQTTADAYQTGNFLATSNQVNATDSTSNNFRLCGVQLEAGSVATEFEQRTFNEELALCQRYVEKSFLLGTTPAQNVGTNTGEYIWAGKTTGAVTTHPPSIIFIMPKRAVPTMTLYNPNAGNAQARDQTSAADCSATTSVRASEAAFVLETTTDAGATNESVIAIHWQAVAEL